MSSHVKSGRLKDAWAPECESKASPRLGCSTAEAAVAVLCLSSWMKTPASHLKVAGFISHNLRATERKKVGRRAKGDLSLQ